MGEVGQNKNLFFYYSTLGVDINHGELNNTNWALNKHILFMLLYREFLFLFIYLFSADPIVKLQTF